MDTSDSGAEDRSAVPIKRKRTVNSDTDVEAESEGSVDWQEDSDVIELHNSDSVQELQQQISSAHSNPSNRLEAGKSANEPKKVQLTCHTKNVLVQHFLQNGCSSQSYEYAVQKTSRDKVESYKDTINEILSDAPEYVFQECESYCFDNISDWLKVLESKKAHKHSYFEPGVILDAIVNNESHPEPSSMGGVDLKAIYTFLSNSLIGAPQKALDPVTGSFLAKQFESLIDDVNSDEADAQTLVIKQKLDRSLVDKSKKTPPSLDPLWLMSGTAMRKHCCNEK